MNTQHLDACLSGWYRGETAELFQGFAIGAEDRVLEIGCGEGHGAQFAARFGAEVYINDLDPQRVAALIALLGNSPARGLHALPGDAARLDLADASVTRIVAMEVLEHVEDPPRLMQELVRVGTPGALYLLTVPDARSEAVQREIAAPQYFEPPNHIHVFDGPALEALVTGAGLEVQCRVPYGFYGSMWWFLFWACRQGVEQPWHELLQSWDKTWSTLLALPDGPRIKAALDRALPKSQAVIARKPA
jgi:SAM-dependent methyltransferase